MKKDKIMRKVKFFVAMSMMMVLSNGVMLAQAPVKRSSGNGGTQSTAVPSKQKPTNKPSPLNGYHEKTYSDGSVYKGNFRNDLFDGYGELKSSDGNIYKGFFEKGNLSEGTIIYPIGGASYTGELKNMKPFGKGTMISPRGRYQWQFVGVFDENENMVTGVQTFSNGDKYEGDFFNGSKHGQGTYTWKSGDQYVGDWNNDKRTGSGTYTWVNGNKYVGDWINGEMTGFGTMYYSNHTYIKGEWQKGTVIRTTEQGTWR